MCKHKNHPVCTQKDPQVARHEDNKDNKVCKPEDLLVCKLADQTICSSYSLYIIDNRLQRLVCLSSSPQIPCSPQTIQSTEYTQSTDHTIYKRLYSLQTIQPRPHSLQTNEFANSKVCVLTCWSVGCFLQAIGINE